VTRKAGQIRLMVREASPATDHVCAFRPRAPMACKKLLHVKYLPVKFASSGEPASRPAWSPGYPQLYRQTNLMGTVLGFGGLTDSTKGAHQASFIQGGATQRARESGLYGPYFNPWRNKFPTFPIK